MIVDFLRWWGAQLLALLPERLRPATGGHDRPVIVTLRDDGRVSVALGHKPADRLDLLPGARAVASGRLAKALQRRPVALRLPAPLLLERQVILPLAAARDPEGVIRYEIDRLTPFAAEDVVWACAIASQNRARGLLTLRLSVVARAALQPLLSTLTSFGIRPDRLEVPRADRTFCVIDLHAAAPSRQRRARATGILLASLCAALAVTAATLPFLRQSLDEADLDAAMAVLRPRIAAVEALRRQVAAQVASSDVVGAERAAAGDPLTVLATLTRLLPDDTYIVEFALEQRRLLLRGQSAAAARLIGVLAAEPMIANPAFAAPVTRIEARQADIFSIRADWSQAP